MKHYKVHTTNGMRFFDVEVEASYVTEQYDTGSLQFFDTSSGKHVLVSSIAKGQWIYFKEIKRCEDCACA